VLRISKRQPRHDDSNDRSNDGDDDGGRMQGTHRTTLRPGRPARGTRTGKPLMVAFDLLGRRWALRVLWELRVEPVGFRELQERCGGISSSVLRDRLAELSAVDIVGTDAAGLYTLTEHGQALLVALRPLSRWADGWSSSTSDSAEPTVTS
jgi:DNA-binding HxlR family transcriptional regulator